MKRRNPINQELINKLAGCGPSSTERPTRVNMARLADPTVPLKERTRLLFDIVGGALYYQDAADCLGVDIQVFAVTAFRGKMAGDAQLFTSTYPKTT